MVTLSTLASGAIKSAAEVSAAVASISCNVNLFVNKMARMIKSMQQTASSNENRAKRYRERRGSGRPKPMFTSLGLR